MYISVTEPQLRLVVVIKEFLNPNALQYLTDITNIRLSFDKVAFDVGFQYYELKRISVMGKGLL